MTLRWWLSGLRFGKLSVTSKLRTGAVYAYYGRFMWIALAAGIVLAIGAAIVLTVVGLLVKGSITSSVLGVVMLIAGYAIVALAYSTIYQATVRWRLWQHSIQSLELSGVEVLDRVKATGVAGSAVGEGLADALNVGGI
jgi:hypothetical protein